MAVPSVPAQLGKAKNKIGQLAANLPEAEAAHQHRIKAAARGDPAQRRGIEGQQGVADDGYPQQMDDGKGDAEFTAGEHRAGEKGKAEQHHGDGKYAFASGGGRFDEGKSLLFDILEPLAGRWAVIAGSSKRCARKTGHGE